MSFKADLNVPRQIVAHDWLKRREKGVPGAKGLVLDPGVQGPHHKEVYRRTNTSYTQLQQIVIILTINYF